MKPIIKNKLIVYFVLLISFMGCTKQPQIYNYLKPLIILDNATFITYNLVDGGSIQLSYKLKQDYPALSALSDIKTQLEATGWSPLKEDYLNLGQPPSHVTGWNDFEDTTSKQGTFIVHQWLGSWEDKNGNIVTYQFRYAYPKNDKKNLSDLQIYAIYDPASLAALNKKDIINKDNK
jgi:hypothetical protein